MRTLEERLKAAFEAHSAGKFVEAEILYEELLAENYDNDLIYYGLAILNADKQEYTAAINYMQKAVMINPDPSYYRDLGIMCYKLNDFYEAINAYLEVLKSNPDDYDILFDLGLAYLSINKIDEAIEVFEQLLNINKNDPEIYYNLALACVEKLNFQKAINLLQLCINIKPDYADALFLYGCICLQHKNFKEGWTFYEYRFRKTNSIEPLNFSQPRWDGKSYNDKIIYVYHEQGYGDSIMFSRFLPLLSQKFKKVLFKPQPGMESLFRESNLPVEIIDNSTPSFDL